MKQMLRSGLWLICLSSFMLTIHIHSHAEISGINDLATTPLSDIYRTPFNPLPGEGIKQLIKRLGTTANEIEYIIDDILNIVNIETAQMHCPVYLKAADFGTTGTVLDQPGYYMICEDIAWEGTDSSSFITVATDHVTIDLNYHSVIQTGTGIDVNGITINSGKHDISIKNGTLAHFVDYILHVASGCYNIGCYDLRLEDSGNSTIYLNGTSGFPVSNCIINNCMVTESNQDGLVLEYCQDVAVINSYLTNCLVNGAVTSGDNKKCIFINSHFDDNGDGGFTGIGDSHESFVFEQCTFNSNQLGLGIIAASGSIIRNCLSNSNTSTTKTRVQAIALESSQGTVIESCTVANNFSSTKQCFGITLYLCNSCSIKDCDVVSNWGEPTTDSDCNGILVLQGTNNTVINCTVYDTQNTSDATRGLGIEIQLAKNTLIQNCSVFSNSGVGIVNENPDTNNPSLIIGCVAGKNPSGNFGGITPIHFAKRNTLGNHWEVGELENISIETTGINEVGCVIYLEASAFPLTITQPGNYILCEDIVLNPASTAITINANNVVLDLNTKSISNVGGGIIVSSGYHDIVIKNGSISDFTQFGISVGPSCYHITIENVNMSKANCVSAIAFSGGSAAGIHDCKIKNCRVSEINSSSATVELTYCYDFDIINCHFNNNNKQIFLNGGAKHRFINCQFNDNTRDSLDSVDIVQGVSSSDLFEKCTFNNNKNLGSGDLYLLTTVSGSIIKESVFANNTAAGDLRAIFCSNTGNIIDSCVFTKNSSTAGGCLIMTILDGTIVQNCTIIANDGALACRGIDIQADNNALLNCKIIYNTSSGGTADGIYIPGARSNTIIKHCQTYGNGTNGVYIHPSAINTIIYGCASGNNTTDYTNADALDLFMTGTTEPQPVYEFDNVKFTLVA